MPAAAPQPSLSQVSSGSPMPSPRQQPLLAAPTPIFAPLSPEKIAGPSRYATLSPRSERSPAQRNVQLAPAPAPARPRPERRPLSSAGYHTRSSTMENAHLPGGLGNQPMSQSAHGVRGLSWDGSRSGLALPMEQQPRPPMPLHGSGDAARDSYMSTPAMPVLDYVVPVQPGNPSSPDPDKGGTMSAYSVSLIHMDGAPSGD
ncbi:uncharacterized protein LAESUDRAFT_574143 [Laetiporus sulphureus 93-53]|uniref:Uncharacterized protein n=1 Tax=Laetiporus sulphureus 93-53 TaxID=1314785 RepID=A0A165B335_9APHY|nr:uncharacterized protein LAESUDRAFT_574143 [Laetiporus sulphureus 93-53]KZT00130.1 hypothetical protein LAESUDRAFT_574143 [Laetiporus sulphureus 93-53]